MEKLDKIPKTKGHFFKIADRYTGGISDIIGVCNGKFVAIELKVKNNRPTALQSAFLKIIKACGGIGGVAYTWGEVKEIVAQTGYDIYDKFKDD